MGNLEEKCLRFVLHYYQKNKLDTQKALKDFKDKHQISECNKNIARFWWVFTGVAAAIFIVLFMQYQFYEEKEWTIIAFKYFVNIYCRFIHTNEFIYSTILLFRDSK